VQHQFFNLNRKLLIMQRMTSTGSCNPSRHPFRSTRLAIDGPVLGGDVQEIARLKKELARVSRELKELKYATQQFVRSCI
jgi:hypothetical protein